MRHRFFIEGMTCTSCEKTVTEAIKNGGGIEPAASWRDGTATASGDQIDLGSITARLESHGYRVANHRQHPYDFDLLIIGSGSAAFAAAIEANRLGATTAMIEKGTLGGTCVNVGCIPSKTLLATANVINGLRVEMPAGLEATWHANFSDIRRNKNELVESLRKAKYEDVAKLYGIEIIRGFAKLVAEHQVEVDNQVLTADRIIIATGAQPTRVPIPGIERAIDYREALELEPPKSMTIIGGGPIGVELSQHFASLGTSTTIVEATERLLPLEEPETSTLIAQTLEDLGIRVITGHTVASISPTEVSLDDGSRIEAEQVFIATGRRPVTTGLTPPGLETDSAGALKIDAGCRTTLPTVFAAGDVAGLPQFVYVAAKSGRVAARNALLDDTSPLDLSVVPRIVFGLVPVASVGITEAQANAQGITPRIGKLGWSDLPRALARSDLRGFAKVIVDPETDLILGATIVGEGAENTISELAVAMSTNTKSQQLLELLHPYLTTSEAVRLALQSIDVPVKGLSCCA